LKKKPAGFHGLGVKRVGSCSFLQSKKINKVVKKNKGTSVCHSGFNYARVMGKTLCILGSEGSSWSESIGQPYLLQQRDRDPEA
jgi:hypothetical protein